jgi:hypothetical protein
VDSLDIKALAKLDADDVFDTIAAGYEQAAKQIRAAKKQAAAERKKIEKRGKKQAAPKIPAQERGEEQSEVPAPSGNPAGASSS